MFKSLNKRNSNTLTSIVSDENGTAVVRIRNIGKTSTSLQSCEFEPINSDNVGINSHILKKRGLDKQTCSTLLNIGEYQLFVVEAPEVPPQELRSAVRWYIQELIDFHIDLFISY